MSDRRAGLDGSPHDLLTATEAPESERYELVEGPPYRFALARREFLGVVGGGLAIAVRHPASAQESGRPGHPASAGNDLAAWIHIREDGGVVVHTGKVEVGQNIRTSLAQTVGDELDVAIDDIEIVMGDTRLTPYDSGTFGSRTTPIMARQLARAAAAARERLVDLAAGLWGTDRASLVAKDGRVVAPDGRSASYGELASGKPLSGGVADEAAVRPRDAWRVRGQAIKKVNAAAIVSGDHRYPSDIVRPGMWYGRIVRPPGLEGTLEHVEDRGAARLGAVVVRDGDFVGIVAPSTRVATRAAESIEARWRVRNDQPSSETVFDHLVRTARAPADRDAPHVAGSVERAWPGVVRRFEATYRIPYIAHVPLEPRAAVAEWNQDGLTVWTGTQRPFGVRRQLAEAFRLAEDRVRVIVPDTGSAYGGKHTGEYALEAARLAKAAGRPVKLTWSRAEEFGWGYFRPAGVISIKAGIDANTRLTVWEFDNYNSGGSAIRTPYSIPNQRIAFHPADSPLRQGSYRGLAATANHYAREMHMDAIARALGLDAVRFRSAHIEEPRLQAVLTAAAERAGWPKPSGADRALGIACGTEKGSYVATAAELARTTAGFRVERLVVAFECGAVVNPDGLTHQVEGAVVQGLGGALFETIAFAEGRLLNGTLRRYRVPRFEDVPRIDVVLVDRPDLPSAGAGETPIVCVAPAIGSAARAFGEVETALPVRFRT